MPAGCCMAGWLAGWILAAWRQFGKFPGWSAALLIGCMLICWLVFQPLPEPVVSSSNAFLTTAVAQKLMNLFR